MNDKKIAVTHVNIRLSISLLLFKLITIELFAAAVFLFWQLGIYTFIHDLRTFHSVIGFGIPLFVLLVIMKTFVTVFVILQWLNEYYEISAPLIKYRRGILFRKEDNYPIKDVHFIQVNQGLLGKFFNFGTITLMNVRRIILVEMYLIHNPLRYAHVMEEIIPHIIERKKTIRGHFPTLKNGSDTEEEYLFGGNNSL